MKNKILEIKYSHSKNIMIAIVKDRHSIFSFYAKIGGTSINIAHGEIRLTDNVEAIEDVDVVTYLDPIEDLEDFEEKVLDYEFY